MQAGPDIHVKLKKKKKEERNEYFHEASHYSMHKTIASNDD